VIVEKGRHSRHTIAVQRRKCRAASISGYGDLAMSAMRLSSQSSIFRSFKCSKITPPAVEQQ
jgi:hypothetical protein